MPLPLLILAAAAAASQPAAGPAPPPASSHRFGRIFVSPMGEPFRADRGGDALADWFTQADGNHDGQLTADEMQQDAARFFATLDVNHDGEIDPDEVTRYEDVIAPETRTGGGFVAGGQGERPPAAGDGGGEGGHGRGGGGHRGGGHHSGGSGGGWQSGSRDDGGALGAARFGLLDLPEPVVAADADFNRGISLDEFRQAALQRFQALDVNRQGRLTLAVLETLRPESPARPNPPAQQEQGQEQPGMNPGG